MKAQRVNADGPRLLDPQSPEWDNISAGEYALDPTPITAQPSVYVQAKWRDSPYGTTPRLLVQSAHNNAGIYFRLSWADETEDAVIDDTDRFPDAAAVLFPVRDDAPLMSMGSPDQPVNGWYWRPDLESPYDIFAEGTGTTRRGADPELHAGGKHDGGRWAAVLGRSLGPGGDGRASLLPGQTSKVAFAVWQGSNQERGGLKAVTLEWEPLEIET